MDNCTNKCECLCAALFFSLNLIKKIMSPSLVLIFLILLPALQRDITGTKISYATKIKSFLLIVYIMLMRGDKEKQGKANIS